MAGSNSSPFALLSPADSRDWPPALLAGGRRSPPSASGSSHCAGGRHAPGGPCMISSRFLRRMSTGTPRRHHEDMRPVHAGLAVRRAAARSISGVEAIQFSHGGGSADTEIACRVAEVQQGGRPRLVFPQNLEVFLGAGRPASKPSPAIGEAGGMSAVRRRPRRRIVRTASRRTSADVVVANSISTAVPLLLPARYSARMIGRASARRCGNLIEPIGLPAVLFASSNVELPPALALLSSFGSRSASCSVPSDSSWRQTLADSSTPVAKLKTVSRST